MAESLRNDLNAVTARRVMMAIAALLQRSGAELTFARVAATSGVAERTLYRHYPTKAALMVAFWRWLHSEIGTPPPPSSFEEFLEQIPSLFAAFEAREPLVRAMLHDPNGRDARLAQREARRQRMEVALASTLAAVDSPEQQARLLAVTHLITSAAGWEAMKDNWGLTGAQASDAAQWAVSTLVEASTAATGAMRPATQIAEG